MENDFRIFLQSELLRRCKKNSKFSARAFARILGIENSALSKLLSGKRSFTASMISRLGAKLGLSPYDIAQFFERGTQKTRKEIFFRQLSVDQFAVIADWYHYAILELVRVQGFQPNAKWVAKKLGLNVIESTDAISRLLRLGYLKKDKKGSWYNDCGPLTTLGNNFTDAAFRQLQRHVLEKALSALEEIPMEKRSQTSMTMAVSTKKFGRAVEMITSFRRKLSSFLEEDANDLDAVYHLGISLYPITKD